MRFIAFSFPHTSVRHWNVKVKGIKTRSILDGIFCPSSSCSSFFFVALKTTALKFQNVWVYLHANKSTFLFLDFVCLFLWKGLGTVKQKCFVSKIKRFWTHGSFLNNLCPQNLLLYRFVYKFWGIAVMKDYTQILTLYYTFLLVSDSLVCSLRVLYFCLLPQCNTGSSTIAVI